jgi:hypothetical protein
MNSSATLPTTIVRCYKQTFAKGAGILCILAAFFLSGCSSMDKPASASFAAVVIANQSVEKIQQATISVFQDNGYQTVIQADGSLAFEREATRREQIDYAGFAGAHEGEKVIMRVRMKIEPKGPNAYWLSCKAYAVCNPGQGVFENSTTLFDWQGTPYQKLLDQAAEKAAMVKPSP